jgi:hypothetical protein
LSPPLRLPTGWVAFGPIEGREVAVLPSEVGGDGGGRPAGVITITSLRGDSRPPAEVATDVVRALAGIETDLLVLDEGTVRCRGNVPAHRVLTAHTERGRGITTEVWVVAGAAPAALCAAVDTARYAELGPALHRALRSYRS